MRFVVSYDVATGTAEGRSRLRRVARVCKGYGVRVQLSVFECSVTEREWLLLRKKLLDVIKPDEDSLRIYPLCESDANKIEHHGVREPVDPDGPLVV